MPIARFLAFISVHYGTSSMERDSLKHPIIARISLCLILLIASFAAAQDYQAPTEIEIDALVQRALEAFDIPGIAVGIIQDGEIIHARGYGVRKLGAPERVDADTLFQIASNTKAMTSAALAILMDEGKLTWDDKVTDHIAEFRMHEPYVSREFTIRDLLTHRSGLPLGAGDLLFWPEAESTIDEVINALQYLKPATSFRSTYAYDNLLYQLAGEVVTRASGVSYSDFIEQRIFAPLGMNDCKANHSRVPTAANEATPHAMVDGELATMTFHQATGSLAAAGGVNCNINSLLKWLDLQLNHGEMASGESLFSKQRHAEMWTPVTITNVIPAAAPGDKVAMTFYALGWSISETMGHQTITHTGGLGGMLTSTVMIPEKNLGILVLTNQANGSARGAIISELLSGYLKHDQELDFEARVAASRQGSDDALEEMARLWAERDVSIKPSLSLDAYAMTYVDNWYGDVTIAMDGEALRFISHRSAKLTGLLRHFEGDTFIVEWDDRAYVADAYLSFQLTEDGDIERIEMAEFDPRTDFSFDFWDLDLRPKK